MKKFVFRLQVVLDRARQAEEELLRRMAEQQNARAAKEQAIARIADARGQVKTEMAARMRQASLDVRELQECHLQLDALANHTAQLRTELAEIDQRIIALRAELIEAMKKRQMLEKLRDKQYDAYQREVDRQELQTMEEAVLPRLARRQAEEAVRLEMNGS